MSMKISQNLVDAIKSQVESKRVKCYEFFVALFGSLRIKLAEREVDPALVARARQQAKEDEDTRFFRDHFVTGYCCILSGMIRYQSAAGTDVYCAWVTRHLSESCIRFIEERIAERSDDENWLSSDRDLKQQIELLKEHEAQFIKFQQGVHANVEKVRDYIFHMQKLAEQLTTWMTDKSQIHQDNATKLLERIETATSTRWAETDKMVVEADKDPVGRPDAIVTPKVTEFRNTLVALRSKIRTDLAAKAEINS